MPKDDRYPKIEIDAYSPKEIAKRVERVGVVKAHLDFWSMLTLAVLAGAFIALAGEFFTLVVHDSRTSYGFTQLIGGFSFSLGLVLVVVAGAELFTGNTLAVMAFVSRKISLWCLLRNWSIVFLGNLLGSLSLVLWMYWSDQWRFNGYLVGAKALAIANGKVSLTFLEAFARGTLCNILVVLAVWLSFSARSVTDKVVAIIFPITAFVASGFEHSIANMYFIPMGLFLKTKPEVVQALAGVLGKTPDLSRLTWENFLMSNLLPVTLGNILGGAFLVGLVYWFIYLRHERL